MKKNIAQDVIPPKKSIRNIELLHKPKRTERIVSKKIVSKIHINNTEAESFRHDIKQEVVEPEVSYIYEYEEPVKHSRKILYTAIGLFVIALVFAVSALFKSAVVTITPRNETRVLNDNFRALKDISTNGLGFQIVTTTKDLQREVSATGEKQVDTKSTGKIVVYNNFSEKSQLLIKTTRFQTPDGLIFRAMMDVIVPGIQQKNGKSVAGSAEVSVEADKVGVEYNVPLKDFTIVGFKGTPKYTKIYARSKTEMIGGFSGKQKIVSQEIMDSVDKELSALLKESLSKDIVSQIPENFVLYSSSISYSLEPVSQVADSNTIAKSTGTSTVVLKKKGVVSGVIFDKGALSRAIIAKILPDMVDQVIKITNLNNLSFSIASGTDFDPNSSTKLDFNLKGNTNFVWVFDDNKLKTEILGVSKDSAIKIISSYDTIKEANIETRPFWNNNIPQDPEKVTLINVLDK